MTRLRIGTRRSPLAIAQADEVRALLLGFGVETQLVPMTTSGDEGASASAGAPQGLKGLWIDTILEALEREVIDLAVHSAKDLPAEGGDGFVIAAVPERLDASDVLVTREPTLPAAATIGTSSLRRRAQLLAVDPSRTVVELRGNVDTRLRRVADGDVDAAVLAAAGLARLGVTPEHARRLGIDEMVPAPGQGCLALQARDDDEETIAVLAAVDHVPSHVALDAERSLVWRLGGGCSLPLGAHAIVDGTGRVAMVALAGSADGTRTARASVEGETAHDAASRAAKALIAEGAEAILAEASRA
ncbi:MAG: hydroxymethylbilane synthase [Actinomycetota bacterium]|nr:hydroxymethylbilane synthase [Actinomycetota bacterium]